MRKECQQRCCVLGKTHGASHHGLSFHTKFLGQSAAPTLAGAPQPAAEVDAALLKTLQHLHGLDPDVLLNIFRLMAEPVGFWLEVSEPQQLSATSDI